METNGNDARFRTEFRKALKAGQRRNYRSAIQILETLAMEGFADGDEAVSHPEIHLYLARAWQAEGNVARAAISARTYVRARPDDAAGWFFLGRAWLADSNFERAFWALRRSLELNPSSIDARLLLGSGFLRAKKTALARSTFEEALALDPDNERLNQAYRNALFVEAIQLYRKGDTDLSRQMLTFLIDNGLDGVVPRLYLAHALRELGYLPEALGQYEAATAYAPDDDSIKWYRVAVALEMGDTKTASAWMNELGIAFPDMPSTPDGVSLTIIKKHVDQEEWTKVVAASRLHLKSHGDNAAVHAFMGEAFRNIGNLSSALNHFRRAVAMSGKDASAAGPEYGVLMTLLSQRDWASLSAELTRAERLGCDRALLSYYRVLCRANLDEDPAVILPLIQDAVRAHGAVPELLFALARCYFRLDLADLALGWYAKVCELQGDNEEAWLGYIASAETEAGGKQDPEAALAAYRGYLERWQDNQSIRVEFANLLSSRGLWKEAADQAELAIAQDPQAISLRQFALWRRKARQYRAAAILYRNMLREHPADRVLLANLVYCLDRMGDHANALALMAEANRVLKADSTSLLIEGRLLARSGDLNAALAVFRKAIDKFPNERLAWEETAAIYEKQGVAEMAALFRQKAHECKPRRKN